MGGNRFDWKKNPKGIKVPVTPAPTGQGGLLGAAKRALMGRDEAIASTLDKAKK